MSWLYSLLSSIPGVGIIFKAVAFWSSVTAGLGKGFGIFFQSIAWVKSGFLGVSTALLTLGAGVTLYRDPDYIVTRFEDLVNWSERKLGSVYTHTSEGVQHKVSQVKGVLSGVYRETVDFFVGYSSKGVEDVSTPPWIPPIQDANIYSPFVSIRAGYQEISAWSPSTLRLHYLQKKGSALINPYIPGQDVLPADSAVSGTSFQQFLEMLYSTVYRKMTAVQNSYLDQVIVLPRWLKEYYVASVHKINLLNTQQAELAASVDGSIPYLYYGGLLLAFLTFYGKVLPVIASYVRGLFDISIRKRQERLARKAWEEELYRRLKDRPDYNMTPLEHSKAESDFYRNYRDRMGSLIKVGQAAVDTERPRVVSRSMNVFADSVAIINQLRVF